MQYCLSVLVKWKNQVEVPPLSQLTQWLNSGTNRYKWWHFQCHCLNMKEQYPVTVPRVICGRRLFMSPGLNPAGASPSIHCARGKQGGAERWVIWAAWPATQEQDRTSPGMSLNSSPGYCLGTFKLPVLVWFVERVFLIGVNKFFLEDKREKNTLFIGLSLFYLWATGLQSSFTFRPLWICVWFYWCVFFFLV